MVLWSSGGSSSCSEYIVVVVGQRGYILSGIEHHKTTETVRASYQRRRVLTLFGLVSSRLITM